MKEYLHEWKSIQEVLMHSRFACSDGKNHRSSINTMKSLILILESESMADNPGNGEIKVLVVAVCDRKSLINFDGKHDRQRTRGWGIGWSAGGVYSAVLKERMDKKREERRPYSRIG
jgi:hypothetical protein